MWNPLDWDGIFDIAADGKGGFVTVEAFPRRVAHFTGRERHTLVREWFGGNPWGSLCFLDPADPTIVYFPGGSKHQVRGKIDYANRTWTMTHLYELPEHFSWGNHGPDDIFPALGGRSSFWEPRHIGKDTYLVNNGRLDGGEGVSIVRIDEQNNRLVPVARLGALHPMTAWDRVANKRSTKNLPKWWHDAMKRQNYSDRLVRRQQLELCLVRHQSRRQARAGRDDGRRADRRREERVRLYRGALLHRCEVERLSRRHGGQRGEGGSPVGVAEDSQRSEGRGASNLELESCSSRRRLSSTRRN